MEMCEFMSGVLACSGDVCPRSVWGGGGGSDGDLWGLVAAVRRRSTADMRVAWSERLPFLRRRALKLSLLADL